MFQMLKKQKVHKLQWVVIGGVNTGLISGVWD